MKRKLNPKVKIKIEVFNEKNEVVQEIDLE